MYSATTRGLAVHCQLGGKRPNRVCRRLTRWTVPGRAGTRLMTPEGAQRAPLAGQKARPHLELAFSAPADHQIVDIDKLGGIVAGVAGVAVLVTLIVVHGLA